MIDTLVDLLPLVAVGIIAVLLVLNAAPQKSIRRKKVKRPDYNRCTYGVYTQAVCVDGGPAAAKCRMECLR